MSFKEIDLTEAIREQERAERNDTIRNIRQKSYREQNRELGDVLIESPSFNANAAYERLRLIRYIRSEWHTRLSAIDTRDIPVSVIEKYETIWAAMRELETEETAIVSIGV